MFVVGCVRAHTENCPNMGQKNIKESDRALDMGKAEESRLPQWRSPAAVDVNGMEAIQVPLT